MPFFCIFFMLISVLTVFLFSPVVIRYTKGNERHLAFHFVFFSFSLLWKTEEGKKKDRRKKRTDSQQALKRALRYVAPRSTIYIHSLPLPEALTPDRAAVLSGLYWFLISILSIHFKESQRNPLPKTRDGDCAAFDIRLKTSSYTFLHTFLVFLAKYKKRKGKQHGRNEDE